MLTMSGMVPAITEAGIFTEKGILVAGAPRSHPPNHALPLQPHCLHRVLLLVVVAGSLVRVQAALLDGDDKMAKIFARLRRAVPLRGAQAIQGGVTAAWRREKSGKCLYVAWACTSGSGSKWTIFLLHESIDLDELYPTVPVSQIVTRRKYFWAAVEVCAALGHVHPYRQASRGLRFCFHPHPCEVGRWPGAPQATKNSPTRSVMYAPQARKFWPFP